MAQSFGRNVFFALIAGAVGATLAPIIRPVVSNKLRPAAKEAIRAGFLMYEQACQTVGEWAETASDLVAEVQSELEGEQQSAAATRPKDREQVVPFEVGSTAEPERKIRA
jgi:gas vesicle protein